jgi:molybdenum cofactor cytidylyltransferase
MGRPKALLPIEGQTFLERIVAALKETQVGKIIVVLGHDAENMTREIKHLPVEVLINSDYQLGQLSSLQTAGRHLQSDEHCDGMLVHLVDHPYIDAKLVDLMLQRFYERGKLIIVPRYQGKRGHPVIFSRSLFRELLDAPMEQGAKAVVNAHAKETLEIAAGDEGVTIDIDTPDEYRHHVKAK